MSVFSSLLKEVVIDSVLVARLRRRARSKAIGFGLYALSCLLAGAGMIFMIFAGYLTLEQTVSPPMAALCAGGALLVLSVFIIISTRFLLKSRARQRGYRDEEIAALLQNLVSALEHELGKSVKESPGMALLAASLAGLLAGIYLRRD